MAKKRETFGGVVFAIGLLVFAVSWPMRFGFGWIAPELIPVYAAAGWFGLALSVAFLPLVKTTK